MTKKVFHHVLKERYMCNLTGLIVKEQNSEMVVLTKDQEVANKRLRNFDVSRIGSFGTALIDRFFNYIIIGCNNYDTVINKAKKMSKKHLPIDIEFHTYKNKKYFISFV